MTKPRGDWVFAKEPEQREMVFDALARTSDPETSHEAAAAVSSHVARLEWVVLEELRNSGYSLTTLEIAASSGVPRVSISPRMKPMETKGLIERVGRSGRSICWGLV